MAKLRFVLPLLLLVILGTADAIDFVAYQKTLMGNPLEMVNDLGQNLKASGLYGSIKKLAYTIAIAGFFFKLYGALGRNNHREMRATIVQGIGVMLMLSIVPVTHKAIIAAWSSSYATSNANFAGKLGTKIDDAGTEMSNMLVTVGTVTTMGTGAAAYSAKALATGAGAKTAVAKGGMNFLAKAGSRIGAGAIALSGFTIMYASILAIAGFIILAVGYVLPLAISFTMWSQTTAIWACVSSALGAILVTAIIPLLAYSAIDRAFIKPAEATTKFIAANGATAKFKELRADLIEDAFFEEARRNMAACKAKAASAADGESVDCTDEKASNIIGKTYDYIAGKLSGHLVAFAEIGTRLLDSIGAAIMQVILSIIYFIAAMLFMGAAVNFMTTILGGMASYAGAVAKGGG